MRQTLRFALLSALLLSHIPMAAAFDSTLRAGTGLYWLEYRDPTQIVAGKRIGWYVGYLGRPVPYLGFEVRLGGCGKVATPSISLQAGLLSMLLRPTYSFGAMGEESELYMLLGATNLGVTRTAVGSSSTISRLGASYGLGIDLRLGENVFLGAEWISYQQRVGFGERRGDKSWPGVAKADLSLSGATLNFAYRF